MTDIERIKACILRHPDWPNRNIIKSLNVHASEIDAVRAADPALARQISTEPQPESVDSGYVTIERIRNKFDILAAIKRELATIPKDRLITEAELCSRTAGQDRNRFRRCLENNESIIRPFRIKLRLDDSGDGRWYYGSAEDIAEAMRMRDA